MLPTNRLQLFCSFLCLWPYYSSSTDPCISKGTEQGFCTNNDPSFDERYILYDVNPFEGFNLRRDVYMRLAVFMNGLKDAAPKWKLVLPPWNHLPHWVSEGAGEQRNIPWSLFFSMKHMEAFAPVVEMYEFLEENGEKPLDHVLILQHYEDLFTGNFSWEDKWSVEKCQRPVNFKLTKNGLFEGSVLGFEQLLVRNVSCISFHGPASSLKYVLEYFQGRSILLDHAEIILHDYYGSEKYWECRRSMKFSEDLTNIAAEFKKKSLILSADSSKHNEGNNYLCVHLRRKDYARSRPGDVPSIRWAAEQIKTKLEELNLRTVFVASDGARKEIEELENLLLPFKMVKYNAPVEVLRKYKDGGVAIIDQIICSRASFFIGTYESTFSFRIQEERELLNFHPDTTFNRLCGDDQMICKQPTRWLKV